MKANCWMGRNSVRVEDVPDPGIVSPTDAIVRVTLAAICGSDLHLYDGYVPSMKQGDVLGHEFMGEVVETGSEVRNVRPGDRVVVAFPISCGQCWSCRQELYSLCENSNPNAWMAEQLWGHSPAGIYGYSHLLGGYAGGQAQFVRVPFADVGTIKVPEGVPDEKVLFLGDIFATGYMAAENCGIRQGDTVAVWGCGPVGLFAIASAFMLGAAQVVALDRFPDRLEKARGQGAIAIDYTDVDVLDTLKELTAGRGPDACIDAVGSEAHGTGIEWAFDRTMHALRMETDRPIALRQAIKACRNGGTVSVPGVYGGFVDKFPMGSVMNRSLTIKSGQTHVQRYFEPLMQRILDGQIDPSFVITHRVSLDQAPHYFEVFKQKRDNCLKVVIDPWDGRA